MFSRAVIRWEIQNSMFRTLVHCFFPDVLSVQNMVRVFEGKLYRPIVEGYTNQTC